MIDIKKLKIGDKLIVVSGSNISRPIGSVWEIVSYGDVISYATYPFWCHWVGGKLATYGDDESKRIELRKTWDQGNFGIDRPTLANMELLTAEWDD